VKIVSVLPEPAHSVVGVVAAAGDCADEREASEELCRRLHHARTSRPEDTHAL
jgi:hypothetical protein